MVLYHSKPSLKIGSGVSIAQGYLEKWTEHAILTKFSPLNTVLGMSKVKAWSIFTLLMP